MLLIKPHRHIDMKAGTDVMRWQVWRGDEWLATFATKEDAEAYREQKEAVAT